jgi:hypothetical protein
LLDNLVEHCRLADPRLALEKDYRPVPARAGAANYT